MTPYLAYWVPEHFGGSGVLATVATGLYVSWNGPLLIPSATRLQGIFFWDLIIYVIEGLVFLLTGLQARTLMEQMQTFSLHDLAIATLLITAIIIVARFVWVFPATYLPRWLIPSLARRDPAPPWQQAFVLGLIGVRGVVSLAAALAIPLTMANGQPFPYRDLILFITFGVIILTLVGLGLMLPAMIRWLGVSRHRVAEAKAEQEAELAARLEAMDVAQRQVEQSARARGLPEEVHERLRAHGEIRRRQYPPSGEDDADLSGLGARLRMEQISAERKHLYKLFRAGKLTDESRRRIERELDLEEASIACKGRAAPQ
jgi:NhaP-type Na+/H+ or K+/H+ antiporter